MRRWIGLLVFGVFALGAGLANAEVFEFGSKRSGKIYNAFDLETPHPAACQDACNGEPQCQAWTFVNEGEQGPNARCLLQSNVKPPVKDACCVSGLSGGDDDGGAVQDDADAGEAGEMDGAMQLPRGSWRLTCRDGHMIGTVLEAQCEGHNGDFNTADIDLRRCPNAAISNDGGQLECGEGGEAGDAVQEDANAGAGVGGLPGGSWQQQCTLLGLSPSELMADCPDADGVPTSSTIDPTTCPGGIGVIDGFLACE